MKNQQTKLTAQDKWLIFLTLLIIIATPFASDSFTPSLPAITRAFGSTADQMQLTMTLYLLGVAVSQLIYGPLSDRIGRRPIILIGLSIGIIGSLVCVFAVSTPMILLGRLIQGSGVGVTNALYRAFMKDSFAGEKMAVAGSYAGMFYSVAYAIAPILGGYIQAYFGWRANFIFVAFVLSVLLIVLFFYLPESNLQKNPAATQFKSMVKNYWDLLTSPIFVGFTLIASLAFSGMISYYTSAPFLLEDKVGVLPQQFGWLSIMLAGGLFLGQWLNAKVVIRFTATRMLFLGICIMTLSGLAMLIFGLCSILNVWVIVIPVFFFCIAGGLVFTNAMTLAFQGAGKIAGVAGAMYGFIQILGSSLTSFLLSILHEQTQVPLAWVYTGLGLVSIIIFYLAQRKINQFQAQTT